MVSIIIFIPIIIFLVLMFNLTFRVIYSLTNARSGSHEEFKKYFQISIGYVVIPWEKKYLLLFKQKSSTNQTEQSLSLSKYARFLLCFSFISDPISSYLCLCKNCCLKNLDIFSLMIIHPTSIYIQKMLGKKGFNKIVRKKHTKATTELLKRTIYAVENWNMQLWLFLSFHLQPHNTVYGKTVWMMYFNSVQWISFYASTSLSHPSCREIVSSSRI